MIVELCNCLFVCLFVELLNCLFIYFFFFLFFSFLFFSFLFFSFVLFSFALFSFLFVVLLFIIIFDFSFFYRKVSEKMMNLGKSSTFSAVLTVLVGKGGFLNVCS